MLKLKYLFDNKDLAHMILENCEYDHDDPNLLKYYRISSNAVYWCKNKGETFFLRFTPTEEKTKEKILAELEFLSYLRNNSYPVVETILSKAGNELEEVATPWGSFYAVAFKEASGKQMSEIPLTKDLTFGLIHYDFELDNLFFNEITETYTPIDFDDSMYNWYELDIEQSLDSIKEEIPEEQIELSVNEFIKGYRLEYAVSDEMLELLPIFRRYVNLFGYVRILRSIEERWDNEPDWLINLRAKLENSLNNRKAVFTMPI